MSELPWHIWWGSIWVKGYCRRASREPAGLETLQLQCKLGQPRARVMFSDVHACCLRPDQCDRLTTWSPYMFSVNKNQWTSLFCVHKEVFRFGVKTKAHRIFPYFHFINISTHSCTHMPAYSERVDSQVSPYFVSKCLFLLHLGLHIWKSLSKKVCKVICFLFTRVRQVIKKEKVPPCFGKYKRNC